MTLEDELTRCHADALSAVRIHNYKIADIVTKGNNVTAHTRFQAASISKPECNKEMDTAIPQLEPGF